MNFKDVNRIVARAFGINEQKIMSPIKKKDTILARSAAMLITHEVLRASSYRLCHYYKKKSHSTTLHAMTLARNMIDTDKTYRNNYYQALQKCIDFREKWPDRKQRFNLHYRVRAKGMILDTKTKTVSVTQEQARILEDSQLKILLQKHKYAIQFSIL